MAGDYQLGRVASLEAGDRVGQIIHQCFNAPLTAWELYSQRIGAENFRTITREQEVVGGLALLPMGQWFGGQRVPITGIAAVAIAPEYRGQGAAKALLQQLLREFQAEGVPIATLYASTSQLYRSVGFEQAGHYCQFSVPVNTLFPDARSLPMQAVSPTCDLFPELYRQRAAMTNGNLDRCAPIWQGITQSQTEPIYAYLFGTNEHPQGYIIFNQTEGKHGYHLHVRDLVVLTPAAARRFWTFVADHRSLADQVQWHGPVVDPLLSLLKEQTYTVTRLERWLVRIVNVATALSSRGYPPNLEAELALEVYGDQVLPENNQRLLLRVSQGRGTVIPGGSGDLQVSLRGLGPLYTGFLSPQQLQAIGLVTGTDAAMAIASQLFAGTEPWLADHF